MNTEPFRYRRRVAFGECDPARIFFAPRAIDYAVEAVEAWSEAALDVSWADLVAHGREARVIAVDCEFQRSLVAGQVIEVDVEPIEGGPDAVTLSARGELAEGDVSFRARVALRVTDRTGGEAASARSDPLHRASTVPPFTRDRRVRYGDCGVSGDAYAPRVVEWAVEAVGEWYEEQLGMSWLDQCIRGRGTPFLAIHCAYLRRMEAGRVITMSVSIPRLGRASIGYAVVGRDGRGEPCFEADMSACYITEEGGPRRSMPFPDHLRERILAYQDAERASPPRS